MKLKQMRRIWLWAVTTVCIGGVVSIASFLYGRSNAPDLSLIFRIKDVLHYQYVDKNIDDSKLVYGAIKGMLTALDDPYTRFVEPHNYKEMKIRMAGEFFGIGIHIGLRDDHLTVISPMTGTPASKAGLRPLDRITSIDGASTEGMSLNEAVNRLRGPKGSKVALGIKRSGEAEGLVFSIVRDKIHLNAVEKTDVLQQKIGYVKLSTFENQDATQEVKKAIKELEAKQIQALILDLRFNGGGLLRNAIDIASLFMTHGAVVHTLDRDGAKTTKSVSGNAVYPNKPLVVLINEGSASASEILAGAIKDNHRGLIVGQRSFGKASVQNILPLSDGSAVLYTIAKYLTPNGTDITKKGIAVDVGVVLATENMKQVQAGDLLLENDTQLQKAIEVALSELNKGQK